MQKDKKSKPDYNSLAHAIEKTGLSSGMGKRRSLSLQAEICCSHHPQGQLKCLENSVDLFRLNSLKETVFLYNTFLVFLILILLNTSFIGKFLKPNTLQIL